MALQKTIKSRTGVDCTYHRIISLANLDFENSECTIVVGMYVDNDSRLLEIYPIDTKLFVYEIPPTVNTLTYENIRTALYMWLQSLPTYEGAIMV